MTLAGDIAKGATAVGLLPTLIPTPGENLYTPEVAALGAVLGHMYSPFTGFRGGKGVATSAGVFLGLCPVPMLVATAVFAAVVAVTRMVSAGSVLAAFTFAVLVHVLPYNWVVRAVAALVALLIVIRHRTNIRRILRGEENRI